MKHPENNGQKMEEIFKIRFYELSGFLNGKIGDPNQIVNQGEQRNHTQIDQKLTLAEKKELNDNNY